MNLLPQKIGFSFANAKPRSLWAPKNAQCSVLRAHAQFRTLAIAHERFSAIPYLLQVVSQQFGDLADNSNVRSDRPKLGPMGRELEGGLTKMILFVYFG